MKIGWVKDTMTEMACTKTNTQNNTKTHRALRRNRHLEKKHICVFFEVLDVKSMVWVKTNFLLS